MRRIGIIGGGQLGRMAIEEAGKYLAEIEVLTPDYPCPASELARTVHVGSLLDRESILEFAADVDVISWEIEHVDVGALRDLEAAGSLVLPGSGVLAVIQDKEAQKRLWEAEGLPSAPWSPVAGERPDRAALESAAAAVGGFPVVQKARRGGYDGRGVCVLASAAEAGRAIPAASLVEAKVDFAKELAVVVARSPDGSSALYPCVEMVFDPRVNLCDSVLAPADEGPAVLARAGELALACVEALDRAAKREAAAAGRPSAGAVGVFGVELFLTKAGDLLVNEVAPRPHNSGHFSIEACATSQFDQYLRILLGLPLGSAELLRPAMMVNLLGEAGAMGEPVYEGVEKALAVPAVAIHLYGKSEVRPFRKMGHLTALGASGAEARERAEAARQALRILGRAGQARPA